MIRVYFNKYSRYNPEKWVWQPYIYAHNCSLEEQREWNDTYLKFRGRRDGDDKVIPDFYSIERDANQFNMAEVTFTDIFGLKWTGKKGCQEEISEPDYEGHLYYWDEDDEEIPSISDYDNYSNPPDPNVYYKFTVGYSRWRDEYIDIANIVDIEYHYYIENHLFKDSRVELVYDEGSDKVILYDSHDFVEFVKALKKFGKTELLEKFYKQVNEHFNGLKDSENEDDRNFYPGCTAEEYFNKRLVESGGRFNV